MNRLVTEARWQAYHRATRSATYGFLSALPLLVLYEVMILTVNQGRITQVRIGAEVWLKSLLAVVGGAGFAVLGVIVFLIGAAVFYAERDRHIPLRGRYFAWLIGESAAYAFVVAVLVSGVVGMLFFAAPTAVDLMAAVPQARGLWTDLALSIGAGLYEELLFRVLLVGGLYVLFRRILAQPVWAYPAAALIGAFLFSLVHYLGPFGDVFTMASFTFRFLFGLALNGLFLWRGFGVAAWTHALYDVMLVVGVLG